MTLKEAVIKAIEQNESKGYHSEVFIFQTKRGEVGDLPYVISNLVQSKNAIDSMLDAIERYGDILSIEDYIATNKNGFGLPSEIIDKAKQNAEGFEWKRNFHKNNN